MSKVVNRRLTPRYWGIPVGLRIFRPRSARVLLLIETSCEWYDANQLLNINIKVDCFNVSSPTGGWYGRQLSGDRVAEHPPACAPYANAGYNSSEWLGLSFQQLRWLYAKKPSQSARKLGNLQVSKPFRTNRLFVAKTGQKVNLLGFSPATNAFCNH